MSLIKLLALITATSILLATVSLFVKPDSKTPVNIKQQEFVKPEEEKCVNNLKKNRQPITKNDIKDNELDGLVSENKVDLEEDITPKFVKKGSKNKIMNNENVSSLKQNKVLKTKKQQKLTENKATGSHLESYKQVEENISEIDKLLGNY